MAGVRQNLQIGGSVTLDATGSGTITLGPDQGPPNWHVTGVMAQTTRPGVAPIPRLQCYRNQAVPNMSIGATYDGSFAPGDADEQFVRGEHFIAVWSGGQSGDVASLTLTGEKWV